MRLRPASRTILAVLVGVVALMNTACTASTVDDPERRVLVIGDEYSSPTEGPAWPDLLGAETGWDVHTDVVPGSGYTTASPASVRDRIAAAEPADTVIIALGVEDEKRQPPDAVIEASVRDAVTAVRASEAVTRVYVLGPLAPGHGASAVSAGIAAAAQEAGAMVLPVGVPAATDFTGEGGLSAEGHRFVTDVLVRALVP